MSRCRVSSALIARKAIKYLSSTQGESSGLIWGSMGWSKLVNDRSDGVSRSRGDCCPKCLVGCGERQPVRGRAAEEHLAADETS